MTFARPSILLTPGPVQLEKSILEAIADSGYLHHRMPEFSDIVSACHRDIKTIFEVPDQYEMIFLGCSGTGMVEAMLRNYNALNKGKVLCLVNGHFGVRLANIAKKIGVVTSCLVAEEGHHFDPGSLDECLKQNPDITAIAMVHLETSVGHVNHLEAVSQYCEMRQLHLLVDMVSSLSGEDFTFRSIRPSIAVSVSGKAIGALPGIGLAFVRADIAQKLKSTGMNEHYFSFSTYIDAKNIHKTTPFTPPVHLFPPLKRALQLTLEEGLANKIERHRQGIMILERIGLGFGFDLVEAQTPSSTTRTFLYDPKDHGAFDRFKQLLNRFKFIPLQNPIGQRDQGIFQLSSMGYLPPKLLAALEINLLPLAQEGKSLCVNQ